VSPDEFEHFDGAYVLGALSEQDRFAFEAHLAGCAECRGRVELLTDLPALLATAPAAAFEPAEPPPPQGLLLSLQRAARSQRSRRRWIGAAAAVVAAAVLVLVTAVIARPGTPAGQHAAVGVTMTALVPSPIHVTATVSTVAWGTSITLRCTYDSSGGNVYGKPYELDVVDRQNGVQSLGTWVAAPGAVTTFASGTSLDLASISTVQVGLAGGPTLLELRP
jgi:hypothetical protein